MTVTVERIGRCALHDQFASGGMASVHLGQLFDRDLVRTVAIKRLHRHIAATAGGVAMFEDEARLSAQIRHPNVVATLAIVREADELLLVMEYIHGVSLAALERHARERGEPIPLPIASAIARDLLLGLDSAHRAVDERGVPMGIVHRDVSPQNVIVGADGIARVLDFGIAKAATRLHTTRDGQLKGKLRYMAPEQLTHDDITVRTDVYGAAVVLWELLTAEKLFLAVSEGATVAKVLEGVVIEPSRMRADVTPPLDAVVMRGLARTPDARFASCKEMVDALLDVVAPASASEVGAWVAATAPSELCESATRIERIEKGAATAPSSAPRDEHTVTFEREEKPADAVAAGASVSLHESSPVSVTPPSRPPRSKARVLIAITIGGAVAVGAAALTRTQSSPRDRATPTEAPAAAATESAASATTVSASASAVTESPSAPVASATVRAVPSGMPNAASSAKSSRRPARPSTRPAPASSKPGCSPIFTTGPDGIQRIKPECL